MQTVKLVLLGPQSMRFHEHIPSCRRHRPPDPDSVTLRRTPCWCFCSQPPQPRPRKSANSHTVRVWLCSPGTMPWWVPWLWDPLARGPSSGMCSIPPGDTVGLVGPFTNWATSGSLEIVKNAAVHAHTQDLWEPTFPVLREPRAWDF